MSRHSSTGNMQGANRRTKTARRCLRNWNGAGVWPSSPTPGHVSGQLWCEKTPARLWSQQHHPQFTTWRSINRWMDKEDVVRTNSGKLVSHQKKWNVICGNTDRPRGDHTKWENQEDKEKDKCHATSLTCETWNMTQVSLPMKQAAAERPDRWLSRGRGCGRNGVECGVSRRQGVYVERRNNSPTIQHRKRFNTLNRP